MQHASCYRYQIGTIGDRFKSVPGYPTELLGNNSVLDPPDPIPNSEVKRNSADDSVGSPHVKVGHCQALIPKPRTDGTGLFFAVNRIRPIDPPALDSISILESHGSESCPPSLWQGMPVRTPVLFTISAIGPIHFNLLFLDGVYVDRFDGSARFRWVCAPTTQELTQLSQTIARRVAQYLFYCRRWIVLSH